jgi:hypothetical protein
MSIGLQWVSLSILLFIYVLQVFFTVLHPRHKLQYFEKAGWKESWIKTSRDIVRTEFDQTYAFMDVEEQSDAPQAPSVCIIIKFISNHADLFSFSVLRPPTIFLMICQHFPPLQRPIFAMNSIVISAPTPSMLPTQSLGGTRNGMFIRASIAWHWIISPFLVSLFIFKFFTNTKIINI